MGIKIILWMARIIGTLMVLITTAFAIGYLFEGENKTKSTTIFSPLLITTFMFWGIGLWGLVLALWNEKKGGIISLLSFCVFISLAALGPNKNNKLFILFLYTMPSFLYLIYSRLSKK